MISILLRATDNVVVQTDIYPKKSNKKDLHKLTISYKDIVRDYYSPHNKIGYNTMKTDNSKVKLSEKPHKSLQKKKKNAVEDFDDTHGRPRPYYGTEE